MLSLPTKQKMQIFILTDRYLQKYNDESNGFFFPNTIDWARKIYPADMFDDLIEIDFAGRKYLCAKDYESSHTNMEIICSSLRLNKERCRIILF